MNWREANRATWDERVPLHLGTEAYDLGPLRRGEAKLHLIEQRELGAVAGLRVAHLQCHFGRDSLTLAQQGAHVVGLDFSAPAITTARRLAQELGLTDRARFVEADVYDALEAIGEVGTFDRVFVTWGTICWIPDIPAWAEIVAALLKPGGSLYFADAHPAALVFEDRVFTIVDGATGPASGPSPTGAAMPSWFAPYFQDGPLQLESHRDYANEDAVLENSLAFDWNHSVGTVVSALIDAGLRLDWLHEHDQVPWQLFEILVPTPGEMYAWPDQPWLPLSYSLSATRCH